MCEQDKVESSTKGTERLRAVQEVVRALGEVPRDGEQYERLGERSTLGTERLAWQTVMSQRRGAGEEASRRTQRPRRRGGTSSSSTAS